MKQGEFMLIDCMKKKGRQMWKKSGKMSLAHFSLEDFSGKDAETIFFFSDIWFCHDRTVRISEHHIRAHTLLM